MGLRGQEITSNINRYNREFDHPAVVHRECNNARQNRSFGPLPDYLKAMVGMYVCMSPYKAFRVAEFIDLTLINYQERRFTRVCTGWYYSQKTK
jgi:hypothetical protein